MAQKPQKFDRPVQAPPRAKVKLEDETPTRRETLSEDELRKRAEANELRIAALRGRPADWQKPTPGAATPPPAMEPEPSARPAVQPEAPPQTKGRGRELRRGQTTGPG